MRREQGTNNGFLSLMGEIINRAIAESQNSGRRRWQPSDPAIYQEARAWEETSGKSFQHETQKAIHQKLGVKPFTGSNTEAKTRIVIIGGVSIYEKSHDKYQANFVDAARKRVANLRERFPNDRIVVLYYGRPGKTRDSMDSWASDAWGAFRGRTTNSQEEARRFAKEYGAEYKWIERAEDISKALNSKAKNSIAQLDYFGHSNSQNWLLNYGESEANPASASDYWGKGQFSQIHADRFAPGMTLFSWGCNQADEKDPTKGDSFCEAFTKYFRRPSFGSRGKTDFGSMSNYQPATKGAYRRFKPGKQ